MQKLVVWSLSVISFIDRSKKLHQTVDDEAKCFLNGSGSTWGWSWSHMDTETTQSALISMLQMRGEQSSQAVRQIKGGGSVFGGGEKGAGNPLIGFAQFSSSTGTSFHGLLEPAFRKAFADENGAENFLSFSLPCAERSCAGWSWWVARWRISKTKRWEAIKSGFSDFPFTPKRRRSY